MNVEVFVEELDRSGHVVQRRAVGLPCSLGRAYDNQVIFDDPFVEPHHARVQMREGRIEVEDLHTGASQIVDPNKGLECRLGRTRLRLRTPTFKVADTRPDPLVGTALGRIAASRAALLLCSLLGLGALAIDAHLENHEADLTRELVMMLVVLSGAIAWAASFDLAGRLRGQEKAFMLHFAIAIVGIVPVSVGSHLVSYAQSMAPHPLWSVVETAWLAMTLATWGTLHTILTGAPTVRRAMLTGVGLFASMFLLVAGIHLVESTRYEEELQIDATLKPLPRALLVAESTESFLRRGETIREELDAARDVP